MGVKREVGNTASRYEHTIPEGYEARIEGDKVIFELKESEDERIRKAIINIFATHKDYEIFFGVSVKDIISWLERQGQSFTKKDVDDAYLKGICDAKHELEKQGEQKPAWSEEDEQYLLVCKNALAKYQTTDKWDASIILHWLEDKLKSLKEKCTWKPSDEQMELLREVQQALLGKDCHNRFVNFMCELKKLKG